MIIIIIIIIIIIAERVTMKPKRLFTPRICLKPTSFVSEAERKRRSERQQHNSIDTNM